MKIYFISWMVLVGYSINVNAQPAYHYNTAVERRFSEALQFFKQQHFTQAAFRFDSLWNLRPIHQRTTASGLMAAKSFFELSDYVSSSQRLNSLLTQFPTTNYRYDAYYVLGLNNMMQQNFMRSAKYFLQVIARSTDQKLIRDAKTLFSSLVRQRLTTDSLKAIYTNLDQREVKLLAAYELAQQYYALGDIDRTKEMLAIILMDPEHNAVKSAAEALGKKLPAHAGITIGVLLPLTEPSTKQLASDILEGINFALDEFHSYHSSGMHVTLMIKNIGDDGQHTLRPIQELVENQDVIGIIGPLFSTDVVQYAPVANSAKVPLISPTANDEGLAATGPYIFQANSDVVVRGRALAQYAVKEMGYTRIAVLVSSESQSKSFADAFTEEAKHDGADVVVNETYGRDSSDLRDQFMRIRSVGITGEPVVSFAVKYTQNQIQAMIRAGADPAIIKEARKKSESIEVSRLFGPWGVRIADSLHLKLVTAQNGPSDLEVPVTSIQAVLVAVSHSDEISIVASQMSYFNIRAQIFGNGEWNDLSQLEPNKRYVNNAIFVADSYSDKSDTAYTLFEGSFVNVKKKLPNKNTLFGYDTMNMLLEQVAHGATSREQLVNALQQFKEYRGLHSSISFGRTRVNSYVHILQYQKGEIQNLTEMRVE